MTHAEEVKSAGWLSCPVCEVYFPTQATLDLHKIQVTSLVSLTLVVLRFLSGGFTDILLNRIVQICIDNFHFPIFRLTLLLNVKLEWFSVLTALKLSETK